MVALRCVALARPPHRYVVQCLPDAVGDVTAGREGRFFMLLVWMYCIVLLIVQDLGVDRWPLRHCPFTAHNSSAPAGGLELVRVPVGSAHFVGGHAEHSVPEEGALSIKRSWLRIRIMKSWRRSHF